MEIYNIEVTRRPLWPRAFGILTYLELHSDHFSSNLNLIGRYCEGLPQQLCFPHCGCHVASEIEAECDQSFNGNSIS